MFNVMEEIADLKYELFQSTFFKERNNMTVKKYHRATAKLYKEMSCSYYKG